MARKAGCIIYHVDDDGTIYLLVGEESNWVSDMANSRTYLDKLFGVDRARPPSKIKIVSKQSYEIEPTPENLKFEFNKMMQIYQRCDAAEYNTFEKAKNHFFSVTSDMEELLMLGEIRFDTPILERGAWTVNFRHLTTDSLCVPHRSAHDCRSRVGFLKGGLEQSDRGNPKTAAIREVSEELGILIPNESDLADLGMCEGYRMFYASVGKSGLRTCNMKIKDRYDRKYGELFNMRFASLEELMQLNAARKLNNVSSCAFGKFSANSQRLTPSVSLVRSASKSEAIAAEPISSFKSKAAAISKSSAEYKTKFKKGDQVKMLDRELGIWVPATVIVAHRDNTYDIVEASGEKHINVPDRYVMDPNIPL